MGARKLHTGVCLFILILLLSSCAGIDIDPFIPDPFERHDVHFDDLPYYLPDAGELRKVYQAFAADMNAAGSAEEQIVLIGAMDRILRGYSDMSMIARIRFAQNVSAETQAGLDHFSRFFADTAPDLNEANAAIVNSKFVKHLEAYYGKHVIDLIGIRVKEFDPAQAGLLMRIEGLAHERTRMFSDHILNIEYDGGLYSIFELDAMYANETNGAKRRELSSLMRSSMSGYNGEADRILTEIVQLRTQLAKLAGYDDYADYAFASLPAIKSYIKNVRDIIRPVYNELVSASLKHKQDRNPHLGMIRPLYSSEEQRYELSVQMLRDVLDEMGTLIDYLERNGFVDVMPRDGKEMGAFVAPLFGAQTPFVYSSHTSPSTLFHEFGHALELFLMPQIDFNPRFSASPEISEVSAVGMEVLASSGLEALYGSTAKHAKLSQLYEMTLNLLYGAMICEFEIALYEKPDMSSRDRNLLFDRLHREYRLPDMWMQSIPHLYEFPLYYITYSLSNAAAIELQSVMENDPDKAKDMYLTYILDSTQLDFVKRLGNAGFSDPLSARTLRDLASYLDGVFGSDEYWITESLQRAG